MARLFGVYREGEVAPVAAGLKLISDGGYALTLGPLYVRLRGSANPAKPRVNVKWDGWRSLAVRWRHVPETSDDTIVIGAGDLLRAREEMRNG